MAQNLVTKFFSICVLNSTGKSVGNLLDNIYVCSMLIIITILFFLLYSHCCSRTNLFSLSLSLYNILMKKVFSARWQQILCVVSSLGHVIPSGIDMMSLLFPFVLLLLFLFMQMKKIQEKYLVQGLCLFTWFLCIC